MYIVFIFILSSLFLLMFGRFQCVFFISSARVHKYVLCKPMKAYYISCKVYHKVEVFVMTQYFPTSISKLFESKFNVVGYYYFKR